MTLATRTFFAASTRGLLVCRDTYALTKASKSPLVYVGTLLLFPDLVNVVVNGRVFLAEVALPVDVELIRVQSCSLRTLQCHPGIPLFDAVHLHR